MRVWSWVHYSAVAALAAVSLMGAYMFAPAVHADGVGGNLSIGAPSFAAGPPATVAVPVNLTNPTDAYYAWNVHLRWDPTLLKPATPAFTPGTALAGCSPASSEDGDGGGIVIGCSLTGEGSSTAAGLVVTVNLQVLAEGCSNLHLFTYGSPDGGTSLTGTYTLDNNTLAPQANTYGEDVGINTANGSPCEATFASPTPTATETPITPVARTPLPTDTPCSDCRTVTPTWTPVGLATATVAPGGSPTAAPPVSAPSVTGPATKPAGTPVAAVAGATRLPPKSGVGVVSASAGAGTGFLYGMIALALVGCVGVAFGARARRKAGR